MTTTFLQRCAYFGILIGLVVANGAYAQINSVVYHPREYNDVPGATLTTVANYDSLILFREQNVSAPAGFANRDVWRFSSDGGTTAYQLQNNGFFQVSMTLQLNASSLAPRREAGFLFDTLGGQGQFIVNTDNHEIVVFGGPLPFYSFNVSNGLTYNSGDIITLGMSYFQSGGPGINSIIYSVNGVNSPPLAFGNLEHGIINGSTLGGYFQIVNAPGDPLNTGEAVFQNISIVVPEPSTFALLSLGILPLGLLLRRRRANPSF